MKNLHVFFDGSEGNTLTCAASADATINIIVYDDDGARYGNSSGAATAYIDFYNITDNRQADNLLFVKNVTFGSQVGQAYLVISDTTTDFTPGQEMYGYFRIIEDGEVSVGPKPATFLIY